MKDDNQITIDSLMARIRELEDDVMHHSYVIEVMGTFISDVEENGLSENDCQKLTDKFVGNVEEMECNCVFDYNECDPDKFLELAKRSIKT